jgi:hypothetical protein
MRKIELVYLHELLALVRDEYEEGLGQDIDCEEYDQLKTYPHAVNQPKETHNEAVSRLACDLTTVVAEQSPSESDSTDDAPALQQKT